MVESFIPLIFFYAWPIHFVTKILSWVADNLPSTYNSKCLSRWPSNGRRTSSLNALLIATPTTCTSDVHPGGTSKRCHFICQKCLYTICLLCSVNIGNQNFFESYPNCKWIGPFCVNPLLHDVLIAPSFLLNHISHAFVVRLFLLCSDSKTFSRKDDCSSNPINTISKYSKLHCCLSFVKT